MYTSNFLLKFKHFLFFTPLLFIFTILPLNAASFVFNNGFESGNISDYRCSGNCPTVTTSPVANGKYSGNFTLTPQMSTNYRTEVTLGSEGVFDFGKEYWLGLDYRYEDWKKDSNAEFAPFQVHRRASSYDSACTAGAAYSTAPFLMVSQNDEVRFITYKGKVLWRGPLEKKEWLHITVHFRISYGSDGFVEAWKNGVKLGRVDGPNSPKYDSCGKRMRTPYFKMGVYKWDWKRKSTDSSRRQIFIDNVKVAEGSNGASLVSNESISSGTEEPSAPPPQESPAPLPVDNSTKEELVVGHWSMENGTGTSVPDTSGNGYTGTLVNGAKLVTGEGAKFDGVNDYLNVGNLDVEGNAITLSAWFLADDLANCKARDCRIISKATGINEPDHYFMVSTIQVGSDTRLRFRLKTNDGTSTLIANSGNIYENQWVHVVAVYDGQRMTLYKDGTAVGSRSKQGNISVNSSIPVWIGGNPTNSGIRPWEGHIDDVHIYNYPLTNDEIGALTRSTIALNTEETVSTPEPVVNPIEENILVGHWPMEDGTNTSTPDISGNGHTGTLVNGARLVAGEGIRFDGIDDHVDLGGLDIPGSAMSISFWFKADDFEVGDARFISKAVGITNSAHYWMVSTNKQSKISFRLKTDGVTTNLISNINSISTGQWYHVAVTYDGNEMKIYRDGDLIASTPKTGSINTNNNVPVAIGHQPANAGSRAFDGSMDDFRIYNVALTDNEISVLAQ